MTLMQSVEVSVSIPVVIQRIVTIQLQFNYATNYEEDIFNNNFSDCTCGLYYRGEGILELEAIYILSDGTTVHNRS